MKGREIKELVSTGWIHTRILFQLVGTPKAHVEKTLKDYILTLRSSEEVKFIKEKYDPAHKEGDMFSALAEIDMLTKDFETLTKICFDYMPASIEIMDPKKLTLTRADIKHWTNDLLAKLHEVAMISKEVRGQNDVLLRNTTTIIRNAILFAAKNGNTVKQIAGGLGMTQTSIKPFLDTLIKEGKVTVKNDKLTMKKGSKSKK